MAWDPLWRQVHMTCEPNLGGQVLGLQWDSLITMRGRVRQSHTAIQKHTYR
jgi:hypothetical protein